MTAAWAIVWLCVGAVLLAAIQPRRHPTSPTGAPAMIEMELYRVQAQYDSPAARWSSCWHEGPDLLALREAAAQGLLCRLSYVRLVSERLVDGAWVAHEVCGVRETRTTSKSD